MHPKLIFMGTPDFGVPTLHYLSAQGFPFLGVVTQPDKPKGRGFQPVFSAVKQAAVEAKLLVWQPENVNDPVFLQRLREIGPQLIVVAAFGQMLKADFLALPELGCINVHASLLPQYRGAAPIQWAIARGEKETGISVQKMVLRLDSGDVLVQKKIPIAEDETTPELYARLAALGGPATGEAIELLMQSPGKAGLPQKESEATFAPRLKREDGWLDWQQPAESIHNRVRAFQPWPGIYTQAQGHPLKIITTRRVKQTLLLKEPGTIVEYGADNSWRVAAGQGSSLDVLLVQGANAKIMSAQAYGRGHGIRVGDVLGARGDRNGETHHHRG